MKYLLFLFLFPVSVQAKTIVLNIPDDDIKVAENDVVDAEQWIRDAWAGKFNKCKERMIRAEVDRSVKDGTPIPSGEAAILQKAFARPDYKSRKQRDLSVQLPHP